MTIEASAQVLSSLLAGMALLVSIYTYLRSVKFRHYAELDKGYFDLLAMAVDKPFLRTPGALESEEQRLAYDSYAYMVWNFLETVRDRCMSNVELRETWFPVIDAENRVHRAWFDAPENRHKFKESFLGYIRSQYPAEVESPPSVAETPSAPA